MSDERIRREFEELQRQARHANPEPGLARLQMSTSSRTNVPGWTRALVAAAVVVVAVGVVAFANRGPGQGGEVAASTDQSTATTVAMVGAPGEPDESAGLAEGSTPTSIVSSDGSTVPTSATTTTIDAVGNRQPVFLGEGWRVARVAADDVLNVRATPDATGEIVGTYAPDSELVKLNGQGSTDTDGHGWWGVNLPDGTEGFVNRDFLEPPLSWVADVPADLCGLEETPDFGQDSFEQVDLGDQPNTVVGMVRVEGEGCDRLVIVLGNTDFETGTVEPVASFSAYGTMIVDPAADDIVSLPLGLTEVVQTATIDRFGSILAILATDTPPVEEGLFKLRLVGAYDGVALSFRANPARVIVDLIGTDPDDLPSWITGEGLTILAGPPVVGGQYAQVEVVGFARFFEAQGLVRITAADGSAGSAEVSSSSIVGPDGFTSVVSGELFGIYASWLPTYGAFWLPIDGLEPGDYQVFIGEECGGDTLELCGVETTFTIP